MAWITKNSATTKIEQRDQPYLDDAMQERLEPVVQRYPTRRAAALPVLHALQEAHGHLPYQAIEEAAVLLEVSAAELLDTVTFYDEFFTRPKGRYVIWVCQSLSCELLGAEALVDRLREKLNIEVGETTDDGRFTLMHVQCLGACGGGPCALVDEKLHENLTVENFERVIDSLD